MAIAPVFETGWEWGNSITELTASSSNIATTTTPKTGTYAYNMSLGTPANYYYEHTANLSQSRFGLHVRHAMVSNTADVFVLRQGVTNIVRVQWNATTSSWVILCGATTVATVVDVPFATASTYYHIGVDVKIDAAAGWVYLYRDGTEIVAFDGDTNDGGATFNRLGLGSLTGAAMTGSVLDDVYWDDTTGEAAPAACPDYRYDMIAPNGNGNYNEWDGSDGNATDNYLLVDEVPHNSETDYVTTATANDTESFAMTTVALPAGWAIEAVIPMAVARKTDALGTLGLKLGTRVSATDNLSTTKALGTGYTLYKERQTQSPAAANWTQSDLDGLELVIEAAA